MRLLTKSKGRIFYEMDKHCLALTKTLSILLIYKIIKFFKNYFEDAIKIAFRQRLIKK